MKLSAKYTVVSVLCILISDKQIVGEKSGPYKLIPKRITTCDDEGTGEIRIGTRMSSKGKNVYTYTNNVTFLVPIDEKTKYRIELQQFKNGAYVPRFLTQTFKNCEKIMKVMRPTIADFLKAANYTVTGCPIPAATYDVRDWVVRIEVSNVPTMFYSSFKIINTFYRDNKKVGCFNVYGEAVPKDEYV